MNKIISILLLVLAVNVFCTAEEDQTSCSALSSTASESVCNAVHGLSSWTEKDKYRCCYLETTPETGTATKKCKRVGYTPDDIGKEVKDATTGTFKILCSSSYLVTFGLLVLAFLF